VKYKEFSAIYRASEAGEIQSCFTGEWVTKKLKKSKTGPNGEFYLTVWVNQNHKRLHILMWELFKGPRIKGKVINHIDGDRMNCAINNLEEITQKENIANLIERGNFKLFGKSYDRRQPDTRTIRNESVEGVA
jgi:hypothetical protein